MDQGPLVELQIEDGRRLLDHLIAEGVPVTAAGWIKEAENGGWLLYIATPLVPEGGGRRAAYRRVNEVIRGMQEPWPYFFAIRVIHPNHPIARAIAEIQGRYPGRRGIRYGGGSLGDLRVEGAYIYPPAEAVV